MADELVISLNGQTWSRHATNNFKHEMFWERFSILEVGANINKAGIKSKRAPLGHLHLASSLRHGLNELKIDLMEAKIVMIKAIVIAPCYHWPPLRNFSIFTQPTLQCQNSHSIPTTVLKQLTQLTAETNKCDNYHMAEPTHVPRHPSCALTRCRLL